MSKKPHKAEEPQAPYTAKPVKAAPVSGKTGAKLDTLESVRQTNAKLMQIHRKVLQRLAQ